MKIRFNTAAALIFLIVNMFLFIPYLYSQEEVPELPPEELIQEMLKDEELPAEIKEELKKMLESGQFGTEEAEPPEEAPPEKEYPREIKEKEIEQPPVEQPKYEEPKGDEPKAAPVIKEIKKRKESIRPPEGKISKVQPKPAAEPPESSNKISLDLKGVDIIDVLKMLSARSNMNIVAGRNVRGRVTLFLKDVDVWDAFEIILAANELAYEKEGDIINVMTERDYEQLYGDKYYNKKELRIYRLEYAKAAEVSKALNQAKSKIGKVIVDEGSNAVIIMDAPKAVDQMEEMLAQLDMPTETRVFCLDYAKAEDIKTKITDVLTKGVGTIQVDERTNKMVISDLSKKMPEIAKIIDELDEKHQEVLIEAKIIQIQLSDEYKYGIDWQAMFNKSEDQGWRAAFDNITGSVIGGGATGGALTLASVASRNLNGAIEVLETLGKTNVISSPRITVLNNQEAKVLVGTNQPYVRTTTTVPEGGQQITAEEPVYIDVGVELTVTPTINKDGFVTMKIKPKISSLGTPLTTASGNTIPVVSTSETETTVMVKDGTTIIIAGLIEDRDAFSEDKIPILGDMPILGHLFKKTTKGSTTPSNKKELVVFLTPYIIQGTETFPEAENVWYRDNIIQKELLQNKISLGVEDINQRRTVIGEIPVPEPKKDDTTKIAKDIDWFSDLKDISESMKQTMKEKMQLKVEEAKAEAAKAVEEGGEKPLMIPTNLIPPATGGYYNYYESLRNRIYWVAKDSSPKDLAGKREDVKVAFTVTREGNLKGAPEVLNKVDDDLAKAALDAVEKAAPFPPFPDNMDRASQVFKIVITYQ